VAETMRREVSRPAKPASGSVYRGGPDAVGYAAAREPTRGGPPTAGTPAGVAGCRRPPRLPPPRSP
jgi:hypothetical protein